MNELISVVIPIYNRESTLQKCVDSVLAQTYKNIEVILVNDGSTDNSLNICKKYAESDIRIVIADKKNGGVSSARNLGVDKSRGEYLFFLDSDDWIDADTIDLLYRKAKENVTDITGASMCFEYGNGDRIDHPVTEIYLTNKKEMMKWLLDGGISANAVCNKLFKKDIFKSVRFDETCDMCEDDDFSFRVISVIESYLCISRCTYHYFQNFSAGSVLSNLSISEALIRIMSAIESDSIVAGDPELSKLAHKKKIAALHMLYVKYLRAGDRRNAARIAHMMRELVSKHGYCGISKQMQARVMLMRSYPLARFVELSAIWLKSKKYNK